MDPQDDSMHMEDDLESLESSQSPQSLLHLQTSSETSGTKASSQTPSSTRSAIQPPSAKRRQHNQVSASCTLCRRRKVKCDRGAPCGGCARAGLECVPSIPSQAPRGRQGGRKRKTDDELMQRIAKLEGLVKNVEGNSEGQGMTPERMDPSPILGVREDTSQMAIPDMHGPSKASSSGAGSGNGSRTPGLGLGRYLGTSFWVTLSEEINGLKDVLNSSSDEDDEVEDRQTPPSSLSSLGGQHLQQANDSGFVISPTSSVECPANPTPHQLYALCDIYLNNVDPIFKVLHAPSLRRYLQEGATILDCSPGFRGLGALRFAICYAATVSMTDGECRSRIGEERAVLMAKYRAGTEIALANADLVNTVEMSTLQAMTIYLASVRVNDTRRLVWTLTSMAVRIAQAMGLHHENTSSSIRPFMREMCRRLWWQICVLDTHAADDRATTPVVGDDSFSTKLPLRINDVDLQVNSCEELVERQGFTDMTFCLICHEIKETTRQLNYVPMREHIQPENGISQDQWTQRIDGVINLQRRIEERYLRHLNLARPFHWATRMVADIIIAIMWLMVYRPLQQRPDSSYYSQLADPGILALSIEVLERTHQMNTDPAASPYRWLSQSYVQWHALAVTIAELCVKVEGPMVERAWAVVMPSFREASQHVADSHEGMLWRPIKKLMNRAQGRRQEYLDSRLVGTQLSPNAVQWNVSDQSNHRANVGDPMFDMMGNVQEPVKGVLPTMNGRQLAPSMSSPAPFDWDPWLAAASTSMEPSMQSQNHDDTNQMAWTNWENFVDDFEGQDEVMIPGPNGEASGYSSSLWH